MNILTVNAGSSSVKVALFQGSLEPTTSVSIENIGSTDASLIPEGKYGSSGTAPVEAVNHAEAVKQAVKWIYDQTNIATIDGIGHRIVHGADKYFQPTILDDSVIDAIDQLKQLAPNHMQPSLDCVNELMNEYPAVPQVACFDTSFFHQIPEVARTLALPKRLRDQGIRRYGFHGLSYQYILDNFAEHEGETAANGRVIIAHLGSGSSMSACLNGKPLDMTMGFTPASGLVMSSRSGDIDPGVIDFLLSSGHDRADIQRILYKESGLLGLSEMTTDMYTLLQSEATDPRAKLAIDVYAYHIRKTIGAFSAVLGGVDSIIFSAGIGERSAEIRRRVCEPLEYLGIKLDPKRNEGGERLISSVDSDVGVHVIHTHEDRIIAKQTLSTIKEEK
ncbi:hypothetical protein B7Y94_01455 [Candidatus Saccharibacteria bacterium 32-49-12]|nr:MAG: hypothetical protein B7Y94_01455 [Candidatus Saccharibacteria bacterium 32-49-12]